MKHGVKLNIISFLILSIIVTIGVSCRTINTSKTELYVEILDSIEFSKVISRYPFDTISKGTLNYYGCLGIPKGYSSSMPVKFVHSYPSEGIKQFSYYSGQYSPTLPDDTLTYSINFNRLNNSVFIYSNIFFDPVPGSSAIMFEKTTSPLIYETTLVDTLNPFLKVFKFKHISGSYCFIDYVNPELGLLYHIANDDYGCFFNEGIGIHNEELEIYYDRLMKIVRQDLVNNAVNDPCFQIK